MIKCCICETNKYSAADKTVDDYTILKCNKCGLHYIKDTADPQEFIKDVKEELLSENKKVEYWSFPEMYEKYKFVFSGYFEQRIQRCFQYNPDIKSLFDIGSGYGFWMDFCRDKGLEVKGIDIAKEAVDYGIKKLNLDIENVALKDHNLIEKSDLYNLCDVLEHLENPNEELSMLYDAMKPSSLLYIQVPDVLGIKIPYNHNLGLPHHIWQFNYKSLKKLLNKNGFEVLNRWHGVQGVIGCYERNEVNLLMKLKWFAAEKLNLGNRLMIVCQKIT